MIIHKKLTSREIDIINLVVRGYSNMEISSILQTKHRTITTHMVNIYQKLDINNRNRLTYLVLHDQIDMEPESARNKIKS
jgi:DNA-binding NarL/FixJ family response regulator